MQLSNAPDKSPIIFAASGTKNSIPQAAAPTPGLASFTTGFPPVTMTPIVAGGIPPQGADFNGILNFLSAAAQWAQASGSYTFDATFATAIGGYPQGAMLLNAAGTGFWFSTADNNANNPDTGGANWTSFIPGQNDRGQIVITSSTTFTVPANITTIYATLIGGGGGGGGGGSATVTTGGNQSAGGGGGGGGSGTLALKTPLTVAAGQVLTITIGAGGAGDILTSPSGAGGATSITGSSPAVALSAAGGAAGGRAGNAGNAVSGNSGVSAGNAPSGTAGIFATSWSYGGMGAIGGASFFGQGGCPARAVASNSSGSTGGTGVAYGTGGAGGGGGTILSGTGTSNGGRGGDGAAGIVILEW